MAFGPKFLKVIPTYSRYFHFQENVISNAKKRRKNYISVCTIDCKCNNILFCAGFFVQEPYPGIKNVTFFCICFCDNGSIRSECIIKNILTSDSTSIIFTSNTVSTITERKFLPLISRKMVPHRASSRFICFVFCFFLCS